ncbi:MAG: hypothetical protein KA508_02980 [Gammaproteobacteria bacterium]|nr:hypothetical protein [Gammaproteobacteria bacterium]
MVPKIFHATPDLYHYQSLLKEEAIMRFCAQQTQEQIQQKKAILEKDLPD